MRIRFIYRARRTVGAWALAGLLVTTHTLFAQTPWYSVTDLGAFANTNTDVSGITYLGRISGTGITGVSTRAYMFNGSWTNLGTLGGTSSSAFDLNEARQVVGTSLTAGGALRAFLWTPGATNGVPANPQMKDLGTLGGGSTSEGAAINASGKVVGYSSLPSGDEHAFLYNGTNLVDLGAMMAALPYSYSQGINAAGHVAGVAYDSNSPYPVAFFFNGSTVSTTFIPTGSVTNGTAAQALNDADHMTGYIVVGISDVEHAFRYNGTSTIDLGTLAGDYSYGNAINNQDVIVGLSSADALSTTFHAFVAVSNTMVDLNTRLDASGAGWTLTDAKAINDWGQIVGIGLRSGVRHGFLLTPTPVIANVSVNASNVLVTFTAGSNVAYSLLGASDLAGTWTHVMTNLTGNGTPITATNVGGADAGLRFYRVR